MIKVFRLAYVDFASTDAEKLIAYYQEIMGYRLIHKEKNGTAYMSNGLDHHNLVITPSDAKGIRAFGYQLNGELSLEEVQKELAKHGVSSEIKKDSMPGIEALLELKDPEGNIIHLFHKLEYASPGFGNTGIVPLKLGHVAFLAKDVSRTLAFYQEVLGFWLTDQIGGVANFITCNQDHHVLNIVAAKEETRLHHIAFQLKDASHQYNSSDWLAKNGYPILWGPNRHTAGHNIATYHLDTDGNVIELFTDMDIYIPEIGIFEPRPWHSDLPQKPKNWDRITTWGTEFKVDLGSI
jgi:catechol-2,3-dioxygenase